MSTSEQYISQLVRKLRETGPVVLLESQMQDHPASTKSYLAANPVEWIKAWGNRIQVQKREETASFEANAWEAFQAFKEEAQDWLFGYFGYDMKNSLEDLHSENNELVEAPDLFFMNPGLLLEIELDGKIRVIKGEMPDITQIPQFSGFKVHPGKRIDKNKYMNLIDQAKKDIYEGKYYEINLSHALEFSFDGEPFELYQAMKKAGPVPFGGYIHMGEIDICSASPERFLARNGSRVWSQPIKGTASRQEESDHSLINLKESEKERAENLMIVDLVRNDLSRIAMKNSVKVSNLFEIQSFETVHQMVSTVECQVEETVKSLEVIKACFPMGSMTGAPKIAAMKAIEHYEDYKRGIYSGAIGYFRPDDDFDFNVVIRTALIQGNRLCYPVGGAITSDSDPAAEWEETWVKAKAITNILQNERKPE